MITKEEYIEIISSRFMCNDGGYLECGTSELEESVELIEIYERKEFPENVGNIIKNPILSTYLREVTIPLVGFVPLDKTFIQSLSNFIGDKKCLEILAGKGSLTKGLKDNGINIIATDNFSWNARLNLSDLWTDVENIDCLEAIRKYVKDVDFIICSWIPMDDIGYDIVKLMNELNPECKMILIGESEGGCTATEKFFNNIVDEPDTFDIVNEKFNSWAFIYDHVRVVKYRGYR